MRRKMGYSRKKLGARCFITRGAPDWLSQVPIQKTNTPTEPGEYEPLIGRAWSFDAWSTVSLDLCGVCSHVCVCAYTTTRLNEKLIAKDLFVARIIRLVLHLQTGNSTVKTINTEHLSRQKKVRHLLNNFSDKNQQNLSLWFQVAANIHLIFIALRFSLCCDNCFFFTSKVLKSHWNFRLKIFKDLFMPDQGAIRAKI